MNPQKSFRHPPNDSFALARRSVEKRISYRLIGRRLIFLAVTLSFYSALAQSVFVVNTGSNDVSVIDPASNTVIDTVPVGVRPMHVEVSPDGRRVYVSNQGSDTVSVIDVASHAVIATIAVGDAPFGIAASPDNLKVYVTHDSGGNEDAVWVIDVATLTATPAFSLPNQAAAEPTATFHPNGSEIWIKNGCGDGCTRRIAYPSHAVLGDLPLETAGANANENHFSFIPGTQLLYAAHSCGCCGHFDRSQYTPTVAYSGRRYEDNLGAAQWTVAAPTGGIAYLARVTHCTTPSSVIRKESAASDTTLATLTIPGFFTSVGAITPDGARLYLTTFKPNGTSPSITVVDTASMSVVATVPVGGQPFGIAISPPTSANNPPVAKCTNVTVSADSNCSANGSVDDGSFDPDGDSITLAQSPAGPYPLGVTTVTLTVTDSKGASNSCTATVTVTDTVSPVVTIVPGPNPAGRDVAPNDAGGSSPNGFFKLIATANCDTTPRIFIKDSASDFVAGPFASGSNVKITQAPGVTPNSKPMSGVIAAHIQLKGDALVYAVDAAGNKSEPHSALVPPGAK